MSDAAALTAVDVTCCAAAATEMTVGATEMTAFVLNPSSEEAGAVATDAAAATPITLGFLKRDKR